MRHIQIYTAIDTIARTGSIRSAAEVLAISPSALNRQVLGIEDDIGVLLFDRLSGGVRLSTAGEIYIRCFRDHLADLKRVESQIADLSGQRTGSVRIAVGPELSSGMLVRQIGAYQQDFPKVKFCSEVARYDTLTEVVLSGDADIGLAVEPVLAPGVVTVATEEVDVVAVGHREPRAAKTLGFGDLAQCPLIVPTQASGLRNTIDAGFAGRRMTPHYLIETDIAPTPRLMRNSEALWIVVEKNIEPEELTSNGLCATPIRPGTFRPARAQIFHRDHRSLPVAVNGIMSSLAQTLAS